MVSWKVKIACKKELFVDRIDLQNVPYILVEGKGETLFPFFMSQVENSIFR